MRTAVLVAIGIGGCAAAPPVRNFPLRPGPSGAVLHGHDGVELWTRSWRPDGEPRGTIIIVHDVMDHGDRYAELGQHLAAQGFEVHALDLRTNGRSPGWRASAHAWDHYLDLGRLVKRVRSLERPLFLLGHGMGANLVALFGMARPDRVAGLILSAPAVRMEISLLALALPIMRPAPLRSRELSSDAAVVAEIERDPLISQGTSRLRVPVWSWIIWENLDRLKMPVLFLHGTEDRVTAPTGSRDLYRRTPSSDKTLRFYDGLYHDLWHEPRRAEVLADVDRWLAAHTGAGAGLASSPVPASLRGDTRAAASSLIFDFHWGAGDTFAEVAVGASARVHLGRKITYSMGVDCGAGVIGNPVDHGFAYGIDVLPAGVGLRFGDHVVSILVGGGLSGVTDLLPAVPQAVTTASFELPLGWRRILGWGRVAWVFGDDRRAEPEWSFGLSFRPGGLSRPWPGASLARGAIVPFGIFARQIGNDTIWGISGGVQFWGAQ